MSDMVVKNKRPFGFYVCSVAFTYLAPIIGGYISDRFIGARYCVPVGIALMAAGYWIGASATDAVGMNIMVALVAIGTGLFKGNVAAISGASFDDKEQLFNYVQLFA